MYRTDTWIEATWEGSEDPAEIVGKATFRVGFLIAPVEVPAITWKAYRALYDLLDTAYKLGQQHGTTELWRLIDNLKRTD